MKTSGELLTKKIEKTIFAKQEKELTKEEYIRLVRVAEQKSNRRLTLILQTVCATGIRISELEFITVEALATGRANVECKGKLRIVFLPKELCRVLRGYCHEQRISRGMIFCSKTGKALDRSNIWRDRKALCQNLLFIGKGFVKAGRPVGTQQRQHYQNLHNGIRFGACQTVRTYESGAACNLKAVYT